MRVARARFCAPRRTATKQRGNGERLNLSLTAPCPRKLASPTAARARRLKRQPRTTGQMEERHPHTICAHHTSCPARSVSLYTPRVAPSWCRTRSSPPNLIPHAPHAYPLRSANVHYAAVQHVQPHQQNMGQKQSKQSKGAGSTKSSGQSPKVCNQRALPEIHWATQRSRGESRESAHETKKQTGSTRRWLVLICALHHTHDPRPTSFGSHLHCAAQHPYAGPVDALWKICNSESAPNMVEVTELVNAGIDVNYAVSGRDQRRGTGEGQGRVR